MTNFNSCESELVRAHGDAAVIDIIGALAEAAADIAVQRRIYALAALATSGAEQQGVAA